MTDEISYFWDGFTPGDAAEAYHPSATYAELYEILLMTDKLTEGVVRFYENKLLVSNTAGNTIRVATGAALVAGRYYENTANVDTVISTPTIATRYDRVVLRCDFAGQTIRVAFLTGAEGGGVPALTQNSIYWEIPLATISITTLAVILVQDERNYAVSRLTDFSTGAALGWALIDEIDVDGVQATIEFSGDYSQYTHLAVLGSLRHSHTDYDSNFSYLGMLINNSSSNAYIRQYHGMLDTTALAPGMVDGLSTALQNYLDLGIIASDAALANLFTGIWIWFPNPNESVYKAVEASIGSVCGSHADPSNNYWTQGVFNGIEPITSLTFYNPADPTGNFIFGSNLQLYGIEG